MSVKIQEIIKVFIISTLIVLVSCGGEKRKNPPNDDVLKNKAFIKLVNYDFDENQEPKTLKIKAETNFPENTKVKVSLYGFVTSTKEEDAIDTYGETLVENGLLNILLKPWNIPQRIEFVIIEDEQPDEIKDIFGNQGSKILIEENNKHSISPAIALFIESVDINKEMISKQRKEKLPELKFMKAKDFTHPSEKVLANFIYYFSKNEWGKMVKYTQQSQNETSKSLNNMFSSIKHIKGFEIIERIDKNKNFQIIKYRLFVETGIKHKGIQQKIISANVIRENGNWGVNAASAMGGLYN